jgi:hypothetical protein
MDSHRLALLVAVVAASGSCSQQAAQVVGSTDAALSSDARSPLLLDASPIININLDSRSVTADGVAAAEAVICSIIRLAPQTIYPEVMIAQDISGSMAGDRWQNTKAALVDVANTLDNRFRLGLYFFPKLKASASNSCELEKLPAGQYVNVAPALGNGTKIKTALDQLDGSPTAAHPRRKPCPSFATTSRAIVRLPRERPSTLFSRPTAAPTVRLRRATVTAPTIPCLKPPHQLR